jgi:hypothetical protein
MKVSSYSGRPSSKGTTIVGEHFFGGAVCISEDIDLPWQASVGKLTLRLTLFLVPPTSTNNSSEQQLDKPNFREHLEKEFHYDNVAFCTFSLNSNHGL